MRISEKIKDEIYLLLAGLFCAFLAAKFWGFFQSTGFDIIYIAAIVGLIVQNTRLKKKIEALQKNPVDKA
ncbi:hypothetical protein [Duganella hordei]|uniref:hypothetical protein n=1 Tax=Duganella hordei TaxID=2865934 RepID=UPI0030E8D187